MSTWTAKRFWKTAEAVPEERGYTVRLDGRPVKTPAKAPLVVPTYALAIEIAREWDAQKESVNPNVMPMTRSANAAIDKVARQHAEVADMVADYGDTDLLCYRAEAPQELVDRQARAWNPYLDWARETLNVRLVVVSGLMYGAQPRASLARLRAMVHEMSAFELTSFHDLVGISGSLILGFAAVRGQRPIEDIWESSQLDEIWQQEHWGSDSEAAQDAMRKREAFFHAKVFFDLLRA